MKLDVCFSRFLLISTVIIFGLWEVKCQSICTSMQYRQLPVSAQNEHRCMVLEAIQREIQDDKNTRIAQFDDLVRKVDGVTRKMNRLNHKVSANKKDKPLKNSPTFHGVPLTRDCYELMSSGINVSGVYPIKLPLGRVVNVYCDMTTFGGGWTIIQRRLDGSVNFTQKWNEYVYGFGNSNSEYWFGNENMYQMLGYINYTLRIDMWDWEGNSVFAEYSTFSLSNENDGYRLNIGGYSGTSGDSFSHQNDMKFSTPDKDNDHWGMSCARKDGAGWWYRGCGYSSLNGLYIQNGSSSIMQDGIVKGVIWYHWKYSYINSLYRVEMKIKPTVAVTIQRERRRSETTTLGVTETSDDTPISLLTTQSTITSEPMETTTERKRPLRQWPPIREYSEEELAMFDWDDLEDDNIQDNNDEDP